MIVSVSNQKAKHVLNKTCLAIQASYLLHTCCDTLNTNTMDPAYCCLLNMYSNQ